jgi:DNA-binding IclR family transcriptional regulator
VSRALSVLKAFTDLQPTLSLAEVSRAVRLNKTTTYRLLSALEKEGLLMRNERAEAYHLGPEAIALGWRAIRANNLYSASHSELEALAHNLRETASLEVLRADVVLILDEVHGDHLLGNLQSIGTSWPAHTTSTGKVLLAHLPDDEREAFLKSPLPRLTPQTITSAAAFRRELARVREQGYATAVEELEAGLVAIGAPIRNGAGRVVAAVSLGGPTHRLTSDRLPEIAAQVKKTGERISQRLGYKS